MKRIEEELTSFDKPLIELPLHQARLRRRLLTSERFERDSFYTMKKLLPISLILVVLIGWNSLQRTKNINPITPKASAQELLDEALTNVQNLSDENVEALARQIGMSGRDELFLWLKEARTAKDLSYVKKTELSCEEAKAKSSTTPFMIETRNPESEKESFDTDLTNCAYAFELFLEPDLSSPEGYTEGYVGDSLESKTDELTFLQYTDQEGYRVVIGVNQEGLPQAAHHNDKNGQQSVSVMYLGD